MGLQEVRHMETDTGRVIELVKSVRLLFMDHERASGITVKGTADLAYVACGGLEAYFERYLNPWNFAGG